MYEKKIGAWEAYKLYWKNTFKFKGRSRRAEFWWPMFFNQLIILILTIFLLICSMIFLFISKEISPVTGYIFVLFYYLLYIGMHIIFFLPTLSAQIRRFHDIGISGWYYLIFVVCNVVIFLITNSGRYAAYTSYNAQEDVAFLIMMIGVALVFIINSILIYLLSKDSEAGSNKWGPNPKALPDYLKIVDIRENVSIAHAPQNRE